MQCDCYRARHANGVTRGSTRMVVAVWCYALVLALALRIGVDAVSLRVNAPVHGIHASLIYSPHPVNLRP